MISFPRLLSYEPGYRGDQNPIQIKLDNTAFKPPFKEVKLASVQENNKPSQDSVFTIAAMCLAFTSKCQIVSRHFDEFVACCVQYCVTTKRNGSLRGKRYTMISVVLKFV